MKKFISIIGVALLFVGCVKNIVDSSEKSDFIHSLKADIEQIDTRTITDTDPESADYGKSSWVDGDEILVWNGESYAVFKYSASNKEFTTDESSFKATNDYSAVYPASIVNSVSDEGFVLDMPSSQEYSAGAVKNAPMHAASKTESLSFKNLCGIVNIRVDAGKELKDIVFTSVSAPVAGLANMDLSGVIDYSECTENSLTLDCKSVVLQEGKQSNFFMIIPAQLYTGGFELDINFKDGSVSRQATTKDIVVTPSRIDFWALFTASGEFSGGKGTAADPYLIGSADDIVKLIALTRDPATAENYRKAVYRQTRDIDMASKPAQSPACPTETLAFSGKYLAEGHAIKNFYVSSTADNTCGFFGYAVDALISNLEIESGDYTAAGLNTGGIAGYAKNTVVDGCTFSAEIHSTGSVSFDSYSVSNVGGMIGLAENSTISNCELKGAVYTTVSAIGGMVGHSVTSTIDHCTVAQKATVYAGTHFVGGIVGRARYNSQITDCTVCGNISARSGNYVGGIASHLTSGNIKNCVLTKDATVIANGNHVGGIVGAFQLNEAGTDIKSVVEDCSVYAIIGGNQNVGGICGYHGANAGFEAKVSRCKSYGDITANLYNAGGVCGSLSISGKAIIEESVSYGNINSASYYVGGIAGYGIATGEVLIDKCVAYGDYEGQYGVGGLFGYYKGNNAKSIFTLINSMYFGKSIVATANNGANGYTLATGIISWIQGNGASYVINCLSRLEKVETKSTYGTYKSTNNTLGGGFGFYNGSPSVGEFYSLYTTIELAGLYTDGVSYADEEKSSYYGGIYSKANSAVYNIIEAKHCYHSGTIKVGPGIDLMKKFDQSTLKPIESAEKLLSDLNGAVSAYSGSCPYTLLTWKAGADGYPVLDGVPVEPKVETCKKVSVIGDSISTFRGYVPAGYSCHYPTSDLDVTSVSQTYWYRLTYNLMSNARLERNIAFSGTAVARTTDEKYTSNPSTYAWVNHDYCQRFVDKNGVGNPDIIIIHGGTNDYAHNCDLLAPGYAMRNATAPADADFEKIFVTAEAAATYAAATKLPDTTFCEAYVKLVRMINLKYPNVKVVCIIGDYLTTGIQQSIHKIGARYDNLKVVDLYAVNGYNDQKYMPKHDYDPSTGKGCHPSSKAMEFIANKIYKELGAWLEN